MKIAILSDLHLGERRFRKMFNSQNKFEYLSYNLFSECINKISKNDYNALFVAGDVFDNPNPDVISIINAQKLNNLEIPIYMIEGNHDYSLKNNHFEIHPFNIISNDDNFFINANEDIAKYILDDNVDLFAIPYKCLTPQTYNFINSTLNKNKINILMAHGYLDYNSENEFEDYALAKEIAELFNIVILGHNHIPNLNELDNENNTKVLTPGSLMPSLKGSSTPPSLWEINIDDKKNIDINNYPLDAPKVHNVISEDLNDTLKYISNYDKHNDIWNITYSGIASNIDSLYDEAIYKNAYQNSLNISLHIIPNNLINNEIDKFDGFWDAVNNEHPEWDSDFRKIINGE